MSILTLLFALLLSGSSNPTVHTNDVSSGGPTSAAVAATINPPTVNEVSSGGPTSAPRSGKAPSGMTLDDVIVGGPST